MSTAPHQWASLFETHVIFEVPAHCVAVVLNSILATYFDTLCNMQILVMSPWGHALQNLPFILFFLRLETSFFSSCVYW